MLNLETFSLADILFEKNLISLLSQLVIKLVGVPLVSQGRRWKCVRLNDGHLEFCQQWLLMIWCWVVEFCVWIATHFDGYSHEEIHSLKLRKCTVTYTFPIIFLKHISLNLSSSPFLAPSIPLYYVMPFWNSSSQVAFAKELLKWERYWCQWVLLTSFYNLI